MVAGNWDKNGKILWLFIFIIIFWAGANYYVYHHYLDLVKDPSALTMTMILFNIGLFIIGLSSFYYKEVINPMGFVALFIIQWGISFMKISIRQKGYNTESFVITIVTLLCFCIGVFLALRFNVKKQVVLSNRLKYWLYLALFFSGFFVFLLEVSKVGYFPFISILISRNAAAYNEINNSLIPLLHYLVLLHALLPVLGYILFKKGILNGKLLTIFIALSFFVLLNYLSRQFILLLLISLFFYYNYYKRVNVFKISLSVISLVVLFIVFGTMRGHNTTTEETNEFLKLYADIYLDASVFDTYMTLYSSLNFDTFNKTISLADANGYYGYGIYTFKPLISLLFIDRIGLVSYPDQYNTFSSLATFMAEPYLDFGWLGTIFINLIYGWVCGVIYNSYEQRKGPLASINWSIISFCLIMLPFANYFNNFLVWFFLIIINLFAENEDIGVHSHV